MQVHFGVELLKPEWTRSVGCVGTFDGVHLGHQAVIRRAVEDAEAENAPCVLVTFDRHPAAVLAPERCPKAIAPLQENLCEFEKLGVSVAVILAFDAVLSRMSAQRFLDEILVGAIKSDRVVVGHDFAMGHNRQGNIDWLRENIPTTVVPAFELDGKRVSSSEIRSAVSDGQVEHAAELLGRPFAISGVIVEGQKLGRELGFPTANLARSCDQVMPKDGVYSGEMSCVNGSYAAAVSIGMRPAVQGTSRTIEAYLLDYPGESLYGKSVRLELRNRLRDERNFGSLEALREQIGADVQATRDLICARRNV